LSTSVSLLLVELLLQGSISLLTYTTSTRIGIPLIQIISLASRTIFVSRPLSSFNIARNADWGRGIHHFFSIALAIVLVVIDVVVFRSHALLAVGTYGPAVEALNDTN
jgi:hypothetical protein